MPRSVPSLLADLLGEDRRRSRVPCLRRLAEPASRDPVRGAAARPSTSSCSWRRRAPTRPLCQPGWRLRHPVLRQGRAARPRAVGDNLDELLGRTAPAASPDAQSRHRARPLHRRRVRRLCHRDHRPQGIPRADLSGRRRGLHHQLAASGNFGQVIRRNYPLASAPACTKSTQDDLSASSVACARRSTCWATRSCFRLPTSAI